MMQRIKVLVTLVVLLLATSMQLSAQKKYRHYYNYYVPKAVTMEEVVECLYNKPYNGKVYIDDELKAAIDHYYELYGAK